MIFKVTDGITLDCLVLVISLFQSPRSSIPNIPEKLVIYSHISF